MPGGGGYWTPVTALARRRHKVVHKGATVTKEEAEDSIRAATGLVAHVESVLAAPPT